MRVVEGIVKDCQKKFSKGNNPPILIMIDELDRCQPDYVISLLERIKNLFEVDGVFFILAIDKEQLYSVVEHTFGVKKTEERDNREIYLQKFVNIDFELPEPELQEYVKFLFESNSILLEFINRKSLLQRHADNSCFSDILDAMQCAKIFSVNQELISYLTEQQEKTKTLYNYISYDSAVEKDFAERLEKDEKVKLYLKLPNWFKIPTPLGNYIPDWTVLYEKDNEQRLYFVVETK